MHTDLALTTFPLQPGVYLMRNAQGQVLYVGKARSLQKRLKQYFLSQSDTRPYIPFLLKNVADVQTIVVQSEKEALLLESVLIRKHQPRYNILLKDDRSYLYLQVGRERFPRIDLIRQRESKIGEAFYFGPYLNRQTAQELLFFLRKQFPLRQCSDQEFFTRKRPCILYEMRRCLGPCAQKCSDLDYQEQVQQLLYFLRTGGKEWLQKLYQEMAESAEQLEFERAGTLLAQIKQLESALEPQKIMQLGREDCDVVGLYREAERGVIVQMLLRQGVLIEAHTIHFDETLQEDEEILTTFLMQQEWPDKAVILLPFDLEESLHEVLGDRGVRLLVPQRGEKRALVAMAEENAKLLFEQQRKKSYAKEQVLQELQEALQLLHYPEIIECYDSSHMAGSFRASARVVFVNGEKATDRYRKYRFKTGGSDDLEALQQTLIRRLQKSEQLPSMMLIDGGKNHLQAARAVLDAHNVIGIDLVAIAKEAGRHDRGLSQERCFVWGRELPITLPKHSSTLFFLQQIRDEAHRFAITYQRLLARKGMRQSVLDKIPGIGPTKKQRLLTHFGSLAALKAAAPKEWMTVKGIGSREVEELKRVLVSSETLES